MNILWLMLWAMPALASPQPEIRASSAALPIDVHVLDHAGTPTTLGAAVGDGAALIVPAYFHCDHLCPLTLQSLAATLRRAGLRPGADLALVVISIDPREGADAAAAARERFMRALGTGGTAHFLRADAQAQAVIATALGYDYRYDAAHDAYAHPSALFVITPARRLARVLPALAGPRDLRLALTEANLGRASLKDRAFLLCYAYDPEHGRYSLAIWTLVRITGALTVVALLFGFWRGSRSARRP